MTGALTIFVVVLVTIVGIAIHGWHFFSYFFPQGAPVALSPLLVPIEILSYLSRLISLSVRLFANMVAGHVMLEVFAAFVVMLGAAGLDRLGSGRRVARDQRGADRLRIPGRLPAGLRVRDPDLHLPPRRRAPALSRHVTKPIERKDLDHGASRLHHGLQESRRRRRGDRALGRGHRHRQHLRRPGEQRCAQSRRRASACSASRSWASR